MRLVALQDLDILDTPSEEPFDTLVELASHLMDAPIAIVGFLDANRHWFKATKGCEVREFPRDLSFCNTAILEYRPMVIEDATRDVRFCDAPQVTGHPQIRFYAGAQIRTFDDHCVGTLCVMDTTPHRPTIQQIGHLELLARLGTQLVEYRRVGVRNSDRWDSRRGA